MPRRKAKSHAGKHSYSIRSVRRDPPNIEQIARAIVALAIQDAEREQQAKNSSDLK